MNIRNRLALVALTLAATAPAFADEAAPTTTRIVVNCAHLTLPSQREVGELLGLTNFSETYAARNDLVAEARRACMRSHAKQVVLVPKAPAAPSQNLQFAANSRRGN